MKRNSLIVLLAFVLAYSLFSCSNDQHSKADNLDLTVNKKATKTSVQLKHLYIKNDSLCIFVDEKKFCIKRDTTINYKNSYAGIYEIKNDSIKKSYSLALNNFIYFTTYEDGVGHTGYLYVFDVSKRILINDPDLKHNYLFSSWGIFIIDRKAGKIFSVNPSTDDQKQVPIVAVSMYSVKGDNFKFYKIIYDRVDNVEEDTTIMKLYRRSLADNGRNGLLLPKASWK